MSNDNVMRIQTRTLTTEEMESAQLVKQKGTELYQLLNEFGVSRELSIAKTKLEEAVMWATKHITG